MKAANARSVPSIGSAALEKTFDRVFLLCGPIAIGVERFVRRAGLEGGEELRSMLFRME